MNISRNAWCPSFLPSLASDFEMGEKSISFDRWFSGVNTIKTYKNSFSPCFGPFCHGVPPYLQHSVAQNPSGPSVLALAQHAVGTSLLAFQTCNLLEEAGDQTSTNVGIILLILPGHAAANVAKMQVKTGKKKHMKTHTWSKPYFLGKGPVVDFKHSKLTIQYSMIIHDPFCAGHWFHFVSLLKVGADHLQTDALHDEFQAITCHLCISHGPNRDEILGTEATGVMTSSVL